MNDIPNLILPLGATLVTHADGTSEVVVSGERLSKTVAFRITDTEFVSLLPFFEAFPAGRQTVALRWLLAHPEVRLVMAQRVADSRTLVLEPSDPTHL